MSPPTPIRLGVLVPSSNTALEPLTTAILSSLPHITVHFSRFPVTEISLSTNALAQFDNRKILDAAVLLSHAEVDVIGWSGTSAGWLGLDADERLCKRIEDVTAIRATTSVLGLVKLLKGLTPEGQDVKFGLVTPYLDDVQEKIVEVFGKAGMTIVAESHLGRKKNVDIVKVTEDELDEQMRDVAGRMGESEVKLVSTFCTNLRAAQRVEHWEEEYPGLVVMDTVTTVVWDMLKMTGVDLKGVQGWGALFPKA